MPDKGGLRSLAGIRWLVLAGTLISSASVVKLVQTRWDLLPPLGQFLILAAGALALFGLGELVRERLRLPLVGTGLLVLFVALVPVLALGSVTLDIYRSGLLDWTFYVLTMSALAAAAARVGRRLLGYRGWQVPAVFILLAGAPPVLARLADARPGGSDLLMVGMVTLLGCVLYLGSRHLNRFLFHRDRRDGVARPVSFLPFLVLGLLFLVDVLSLGLTAGRESVLELLALPFSVFGAVLLMTGEEYVTALSEARGRRPAAWPRRSRMLLASGHACLLMALPAAWLLGPATVVRTLVSLVAGGVFLTWSRESGSALSRFLGLPALATAWLSLPGLAPVLSMSVREAVSRFTSIPPTSPGMTSLWLLPLLMALVWEGGRLGIPRKGGPGAPDRAPAPHSTRTLRSLRRSHALSWTLLAAITAGLAGASGPSCLWVGPILLATCLVALRRLDRPEPLAGVHLSILVVALAPAGWFGDGFLGMRVIPMGLGSLAALLVGVVITHLPGFRNVRERSSFAGWGPALALPTVGPLLLLLAAAGLHLKLGQSRGALEAALLGSLLVGSAFHLGGSRVSGPVARWVAAVLAGTGTLLGVSGLQATVLLELAGRETRPAPVASVLSLALFLIAWLVQGVQDRLRPPAERLLRVTTDVCLALSACLGLAWFGVALLEERLTLEPVVFLVMAAWTLVTGLRRSSPRLVAGTLGLLHVFLGFQLHALGWIESMEEALLAGGGLLAASYGMGLVAEDRNLLSREGLERAVAPALRLALQVWLVAASLTLFVFAGWPAFLLALSLPALASLDGWTGRGKAGSVRWISLGLCLFPVAHLALLLSGWEGRGFLMEALAQAGFRLVPTLVALLSLWRLAAAGWIRREDACPPRGLLTGVETATASLWLGGWLWWGSFVPLQHLLLAAGCAVMLCARLDDGLRRPTAGNGWALQAWGGLLALEMVAAEWIPIDAGWATFGLLAWASVQAILSRGIGSEPHRVWARSLGDGAVLMAAGAGILSLARTGLLASREDPWFTIFPAFLASAWFLSTWTRRRLGVIAVPISAALLGGGLAFVLRTLVVRELGGAQLYCLAPGAALLLLGGLTRDELGELWSRRIFTLGACFLYATPMVGLWHDLSWGGQASLLVLSVFFGALSFLLRSRSLLVASTAAMVVDLACFLLLVGRTEPMLLWVSGLVLGLALLGLAGWLEHRREGVLQQMRVFGRRIRHW